MTASAPTGPTPGEQEEIDRANASGKQPVVFVHGLWLLDSSWDQWARFFEDAGYVAVTPGWPDDPLSVEEAHAHPEVFAGKGVGDVAAYQQMIIERLDRKPALIGHSFGGVLVQILAGRGLSAATCAIDPAPSRGVLPLPLAALKASFPVLGNPANRHRAVTLTFDQFRFGFANAVGEDEARELYEQYHVAGSGVPVFQAAFANINPNTEVAAEKTGDDRGPMLVMSGELDHQAPHAIASATYEAQKRNEHFPTEFVEIEGRGHSLTIDAGWPDVARTCLDFVGRFVK
ncbi:alpha/beta hydrolase [Actinomycetospora sp. NBRC 106375]|uniref:alpha/beta hydrolase n=1 Tax=Actinomycetospora sp. NBRC 106375 TaxID=3032207 RepID=UPI0024A24BAD|nr:alpha/beta hydrolase [Actinomycetospora sp. NBRC 106375]GLZ49679.1 alpha/beta hydrolase [Actinomycetospora sp. NBRC 106375]